MCKSPKIKPVSTDLHAIPFYKVCEHGIKKNKITVQTKKTKITDYASNVLIDIFSKSFPEAWRLVQQQFHASGFGMTSSFIYH